MQKRSSKLDVNVTAFNLVQQVTGQAEPATDSNKDTTQKNPAAVALGKLGGLKGGKARAAKLTDAERKAIAEKAAKARWDKKNP